MLPIIGYDRHFCLLFHAASEAMTIIAANPEHLGARIRITAVQHTSDSAMTHHPHIHMIVPDGHRRQIQ